MFCGPIGTRKLKTYIVVGNTAHDRIQFNESGFVFFVVLVRIMASLVKASWRNVTKGRPGGKKTTITESFIACTLEKGW